MSTGISSASSGRRSDAAVLGDEVADRREVTADRLSDVGVGLAGLDENPDLFVVFGCHVDAHCNTSLSSNIGWCCVDHLKPPFKTLCTGDGFWLMDVTGGQYTCSYEGAGSIHTPRVPGGRSGGSA